MPELLTDQYDKQMCILLKQYEIDHKKLLMEYTYDADILDGSYLSEAGEDQKVVNKNNGNQKETPSKFTIFIQNLVTRIKRLASDVLELITSFSFKKKDRVGVDEFKNSATGQKEMDKLERQLQNTANDIIMEGNNIIHKIMSTAGCSPEVIHAFSSKVANASKFIKKHNHAIKAGVISAGTLGAYRLFTKSRQDTIALAGEEALKADAIGEEQKVGLTEVFNGMQRIYTDFLGVMDFASSVKN